MKNLLLLIVLNISVVSLSGQSLQNANRKTFYLSSGNSLSGSGDINGFYIQLGLQKKVNRWNYSISQSTTIHDGTYPIFFQTPSGADIDGSIKHSVTGIEVIPMVGYSLISTRLHDFQLSIGAILRYQSSGDNDSYVLLYPAATGLPIPVLYFTNDAPLRTFAIGPIVQASYDLRLSKRLKIGASWSFQFDTNGDNLTNYGLRIGYMFH